MNSENLTAAAHLTTRTSAVPPASHVTIVKLELPQQSTPHYDVTLRLCRPLTNYESHEMAAHQSIGLDVSPDDPSELIATHTTIEEVRDRLPEFHELLCVAAANGHDAQDLDARAQRVLAVEEERRQTLVTDTNNRLGACPHTHDPLAGGM
jgi:hypothetical protein